VWQLDSSEVNKSKYRSTYNYLNEDKNTTMYENKKQVKIKSIKNIRKQSCFENEFYVNSSTECIDLMHNKLSSLTYFFLFISVLWLLLIALRLEIILIKKFSIFYLN